jgi:cysteine desulfuration protein SufE
LFDTVLGGTIAMDVGTLPARLNEIIDDFQFVEGREKIELLLEYSKNMPPLPDWLRDEHDQMESVPECMTPVFVKADLKEGGMHFYFDVPRESPTVRGYAAILAEGLAGVTPEEVLAVPNDFFHQMGLDKVLTSQRLNGMSAILAHMKRLALAEKTRGAG